MKEAELSSHQLADEQYGSWCFKDAITQCLNKRLWYDYVCFWKEPAALCLNDAKSCYDCIDLLVAVLCMYHLGVSKPLVFSMMNALHSMHHHTRTAHGDLMQYASWKTWVQPAVGISQGNDAGPAIWAAVNSSLFVIMKDNGF